MLGLGLGQTRFKCVYGAFQLNVLKFFLNAFKSEVAQESIED